MKDVDGLVRTGATSSMTGYITDTLADSDGAAEFARTPEQSLRSPNASTALSSTPTAPPGRGLPVKPSHLGFVGRPITDNKGSTLADRLVARAHEVAADRLDCAAGVASGVDALERVGVA